MKSEYQLDKMSRTIRTIKTEIIVRTTFHFMIYYAGLRNILPLLYVSFNKINKTMVLDCFITCKSCLYILTILYNRLGKLVYLHTAKIGSKTKFKKS